MVPEDITILFVDDEVSALNAVKRYLIGEPYEFKFAEGGAAALGILEEHPVHVIVTDMKMPEMDGLTLLKEVKKKYPMTIRLVLSGHTELSSILPAINTGEIYRYITKPMEPDQFRLTLRDAVSFYLLNLDKLQLVEHLKKQNRELAQALKEKNKAEKALEAAEATEKEAQSRIEKILLKGQVPESIDGAELSVLSLSARHMGGDFHEIIETGTACFDLLIGDVMGKGLLAALVGAGTKQRFLKALGQGKPHPYSEDLIPPRELTQMVQKEIAPRLMALESFVTTMYARIDLRNEIVRYTDCGHPPILHYRASENSSFFHKGENTPLGFMETEAIREAILPIMPGDLLILYSDGLLEVSSPEGEQFGQERLAQVINTHHHLVPDDLLNRLYQTLDNFSGKRPLEDDLTCLCVAIKKTGF